MNDTRNILAECGQDFIARGIPIIPVVGKKPAIGQWQKSTVRWFQWISEKFPSANIGILTGSPSGITVVDVDDLDYVNQAIDLFGDTCLKVATPHGMHLYYRSRGERRRIRFEGLPIDIIGQKSFCIAPPSEVAKGAYSFAEGGLSNVEDLPFMALTTNHPTDSKLPHIETSVGCPTTKTNSLLFEIGTRNNDLFLFGCQTAYCSSNRDEIERAIRARNQQSANPLHDREVATIIDSIFKYKAEGKLRLPGGEQWVSLTKSEIEQLPPVALYLLATLKLCHGAKHGGEFYLANAIRHRLGVGRYRYKEAKKQLQDQGFIEITSHGGRGPNDPPRAKLLTSQRCELATHDDETGLGDER